MTSTGIKPQGTPHLSNSFLTSANILVGLLALTLLARLYFVFTANVNWDEFHYLSQVYDYKRGTLTTVFQTLHVHFFGWLSWTSNNEVEQIIFARIIMFACSLATAYFLYAISRQFTSVEAALFATLGYSAFSYTLYHAASFRSDPLVTVTLMAALYLLLCHGRNLWAMGVSGALIGLSGIITIKAAFYVPTFGLILLAQIAFSENRPSAFAKAALLSVTAACVFGIVYSLHAASLASVPHEETAGMVSGAVSKTLLSGQAFPQLPYLLRALQENNPISIALLIGLAISIVMLIRRQSEDRLDAWVTLFLVIPLLTLVFYRNSFPYYYPFIMAPAFIVLAHAFKILKKATNIFVLIALGAVIFQFADLSAKRLQQTQLTQHKTLGVVHKMFPAPVAYIDRSSMASSFEKKGIFMSSWGIETYRDAGAPIMRDILRDAQPKFLLANVFDLNVSAPDYLNPNGSGTRLIPEDALILKQNFVHHWGMIHVPGKEFLELSNTQDNAFEIYIEGLYTIESDHPVHLNGAVYNPERAIFLKSGQHVIRASLEGQTVRLRWGQQLYKPETAAPSNPVFYDF